MGGNFYELAQEHEFVDILLRPVQFFWQVIYVSLLRVSSEGENQYSRGRNFCNKEGCGNLGFQSS